MLTKCRLDVDSFPQQFCSSTFLDPSALFARLLRLLLRPPPFGFCVMVYSLGRQLRQLLAKFHTCFDADAARLPNIAAALQALESAVQEALPPWQLRAHAGIGRPRAKDPLRSRRNAVAYAKAKVRRLQEKLRTLELVKRRKGVGRLSPLFLARAALASPTTSARSFEKTWSDLVGSGDRGISRRQIARIRDAFVGVLKERSAEQLEAIAERAAKCARIGAAARAPSLLGVGLWAAGSSMAAASRAPSFATASVLHIQDEAALRLRSMADLSVTSPSRSRSSMVQQHVVSVHFGDGAIISVPTEMDALERKTAAVMATSLDRVLRHCAQTIGRGFASSRLSGLESDVLSEPWLVHILVGDGITTNEAAAKRLLAGVDLRSLPSGLCYFLLVVRCASHQANLAVASAVSGRAAKCGEEHTAEAPEQEPQDHRALAGSRTAPHRNLCGAVVRVFKYLVSDYYDEYVANLRTRAELLEALVRTPATEAAHQKAVLLQRLYGEDVLPQSLLCVLNAGLDSWGTCAQEGRTLAASRESLFQLLRRRILVVDEHPTLTRMFTFAGHVHTLLLLELLGLSDEVFQVHSVQPREYSSKRLAKVRAYLAAAATPQYLRRTSLAMQMTSHVHNICGQLNAKKLPLLVRLCQGEVPAAVDRDLAQLLARLHMDPALDVAAACALLLCVSAELVARFRQYEAFPYRLCRLCKAFDDNAIGHCVEFLRTPDSSLDTGFSIPLKKLAEQRGGVRYLLSDSVQSALKSAFDASAASSLPVERLHAQAKRQEAARLSSVSTASRNQLLRSFLREREEALSATRVAEANLRRVLKQRISSLTWELRADLAPVGLPLAPAGAAAAPAPARAAAAPAPAKAKPKAKAAAAPAPPRAAAAPAGAADLGQAARGERWSLGDKDRFSEYVEEHTPLLKDELQRRRDNARKTVTHARRGLSPLSELEWVEWFQQHEDAFAESMKTASHERRVFSGRLCADSDLPGPVERLAPRPLWTTRADKLSLWQRILWGRTGFFGVQLSDGRGVECLFVYTFRKVTFAVDLSPWKRGASGSRFELADTADFRLSTLLVHIEELEKWDIEQVVELQLRGAATPGKLTLKVDGAWPLKEPPKQSRRRSEADSTGDSEADSDEDADAAGQARADASSAGSDSSRMSVDTQADSASDSDCDALPVAGGRGDAADAVAAFAPGAAAALDGEASEQEAEGPELAAAALGEVERLERRLGELQAQRHPHGTWNVWSSQWFYITQTAGWTDLKAHVKTPHRGIWPGMGVYNMTKTLSPHTLGEQLANPVRTKLVLRAWAIWRARQGGWVQQAEYRLREQHSQVLELTRDLRAAQVAPGSLGHDKADAKLREWVPDILTALRGEASA